MQGVLHPSLQAYIDCCANPLVSKGWPRGGGIWDQDPTLVRHFRIIRDYERQWKEAQEQIERAKSGQGGQSPLGSALDQYIEQMGESQAL